MVVYRDNHYYGNRRELLAVKTAKNKTMSIANAKLKSLKDKLEDETKNQIDNPDEKDEKVVKTKKGKQNG